MLNQLTNAVFSTYILGQSVGGCAVCINSRGLLLTNAHCVIDTEEFSDVGEEEHKKFCLERDELTAIDMCGNVFIASCIGVDFLRDLAILKIEKQYIINKKNIVPTLSTVFKYVKLQTETIQIGCDIICVGASSNLTKSRPVSLLEGKVLGLSSNLHHNLPIGALCHDCWTDWGYSGCPLFSYQGELIGVHNSSNPITGLVHGVPAIAIQYFIDNVNKISDNPIIKTRTKKMRREQKQEEGDQKPNLDDKNESKNKEVKI